jgi:kumamolisin
MFADKKRPNALPDFTRWLAGSERPRPARHKHLGALDREEPVDFTLVVRRRPNGPPLPSVEKWRQAPMGKRPYVSAAEYAGIYGAEPAEVEMAAEFVRARGMTVLESHAGRRTLSILGTAAQVNAAFGIELQRYADPRATELSRSALGSGHDSEGSARSHRGFDGAIYLPAELAEIVVAVVGLDNRFLGGSRGAAAVGPGGASYPFVFTAAQRYNFPNADASSETIGILAAQAPGFPGTAPCYLPSDINHLYFSSLPAEYQTRPASIVDINLTVGATTYKNDPSQVTKITSLARANNAILELTQDISTSATIAQGATVNVYFTEASEQGYLKFMNRVLLPEKEKQPTALSVSLGIYEGDDAKRARTHSGAGASGGSSSPAYLIDELFRQIAALGVSIFVAMGDCCADNWRLLAAPNLVPPTATHELDYGMHGLAATWSRVTATDSMSEALPADLLHRAAGIAGAADLTGIQRDRREIPDMAGNMVYSGFFVNGISYSYMGTSCVASFYAGMTAMLRSAFGSGLGFLNTILFELRNTKLRHGSRQDDDSCGRPGNAASPHSSEEGPGPEESPFVAGSGWDARRAVDKIDRAQYLRRIGSLGYIPSY